MWMGHEVIVHHWHPVQFGKTHSQVPESTRTRGLGVDPVWLQKPDGRGPRADVISSPARPGHTVWLRGSTPGALEARRKRERSRMHQPRRQRRLDFLAQMGEALISSQIRQEMSGVACMGTGQWGEGEREAAAAAM